MNCKQSCAYLLTLCSASLLHCIVLTVVIYNVLITNFTCRRVVILCYRWNKKVLVIQGLCDRLSTPKNPLSSTLTRTLFAPAVCFGRQFQNFTSPDSNFCLRMYWWKTDPLCMCAYTVPWLHSNSPPCSGVLDMVLPGFCAVRNETSV